MDNLSAIRKGDRVILTWSPPTETTDHQSMRWPTTTRICRVLNQFPINACGEAVKEIKSSELVSAAPGARRPLVSFEDVLPPALIAPQNQATYAIEVVNQRGHSAGLSNQVRIPLRADRAAARRFPRHAGRPRAAAGVGCAGRCPRLLRTSPTVCASTGEPAERQGKTVAAAFASACTRILRAVPYRLGEGEARDSNFEWEQEYDYKIDAVTVLAVPGRAAVEVEGDDSELVHLMAHDVFPPAVPSGLQAVFSSVGQKPFIDLTWAPNTESDLAGYIVYRRTAGSDFAVVSTAPIKAPAWRDNDVQPGQTYYYTVAAVDVRGNQSAQSAPAEETVPLEVR